MKRSFFPLETFRPSPTDGFNLLPFRFTRLNDSAELLVNECGEYVIAPIGTAGALLRRERLDGKLYHELKARHFIYDDQSSALLDILATKYRTKKSFLDGFTQLHIFVATLRCEHSCPYCQVSRQCADKSQYDMSRLTADKSLDLMFAGPAKTLTLEFQGGEPLLNFPLIRHVVQGAKARAEEHERNLRLVIATNLAMLTDEMLEFCRAESIHLSTSLDGPPTLHNANRPRPEKNSHETVVRNIARARQWLGDGSVAALMTTTKRSLGREREIIDEYVRMGFRSIFLRRLSPYGFAVKTRDSIGYSADDFIQFYIRALDYIVELNRSGICLEESYAKLLLTKILTPFPTGYVDLQSPAGAGISVIVYNYDGRVYASDEARMLAEMGDETFLLGNVREHSFAEIFGGAKMQSLVAESCVESLPGCADCAFQSYCGADPVYNHATQGDFVGHRPTSDFCKINMAIIRHLFELIRSNDRELMRIFFTWIRELDHREMKDGAPG